MDGNVDVVVGVMGGLLSLIRSTALVVIIHKNMDMRVINFLFEKNKKKIRQTDVVQCCWTLIYFYFFYCE